MVDHFLATSLLSMIMIMIVVSLLLRINTKNDFAFREKKQHTILLLIPKDLS